jgi:hypothetical protein
VILFTVNKDVPSEYVRFQGWVPVRAMVTGVVSPSQIVADPLMTAVGLGLTVTIAFPERYAG